MSMPPFRTKGHNYIQIEWECNLLWLNLRYEAKSWEKEAIFIRGPEPCPLHRLAIAFRILRNML